jgi:hypothetical protein
MSKRPKSQKAKPSPKRTSDQETSREEILREFGASTSDIIQKAAVILEEEVAAGIMAAKEVERSMRENGDVRSEAFDDVMVRLRRDAHVIVNIIGEQVDQVRSEEFDELSQRFQKDAHEVVDLFLNVVGNAPGIIDRLLQSANIRTGQSSSETMDDVPS